MRRMAVAMWLVFAVEYAFAGVQWTQTVVSSDTQANVETVVMTCYAQDGNLRQEFTQVKRRTRAGEMEKGFWLFRADVDSVAIVDDEEKSYVAMSVEDLVSMTGGMSSLMNMKINKPSVSVEKLSPEKFGGYDCSRYRLLTSYDLEMKMAVVDVRQRVEQVTDYWLARTFPVKEVPAAFITKQYWTGRKEVDMLIKKTMEAHREMGAGFPVRTITRCTTTDTTKKNVKPQATYIETVVSGVKIRPLPAFLFSIPTGYTKMDMHSMEGVTRQDPSGTKSPRSTPATPRTDSKGTARQKSVNAEDAEVPGEASNDGVEQEMLKKGLHNLFFR